MGRQSSRMVYQGKDHKDVFFHGSFHNAMYARGEVVWKKLYDKYCYPTGSLRIYDLVENQWQTDKSDYLLSQMRSNLLTAIALITKDKKQYIALTQDLVEWHIVKAIKLPDSDKNFKVVFQNHNEGYFVAVIGGSYNSYENRLYSVDVLWEKKVVELDIPNVNIGMTPIAGISDSFWFFTFKNNQVYFLNKIDRNGILKTKEITDSTFEGFLPYSVFSDICVIDSCVYLFATKIGTDKIFRIMSIHGMADDTLYTEYPIGRINNWNYSVVYDDEAKICAMLYKPDYREMRYVQMMGSGSLTHMIYEKENDEINIPIVNSSGLAYNGNPIPDSIDLILSLEGLSQLIHTVNLVKERLNPDLDMEGVVFTMYDSRTNLSMQVVENVKNHFKQNVYNTVIPRNIRLAEAPSYGMPISMYDPKSAGAEAYMLLADEVINRKGA